MNWQHKQESAAARVKQPWEDCDRIRKPFYKPADIAIRWCGLAEREAEILALLPEPWHIQRGELTQYQCLAVHSEAVEMALKLGKLPYGRDGLAANDHVTSSRRTIAHADLKAWLRKEFPADVQKPHMTWLFDDVERTTHDAITVEAYQSLAAERDALKREVDALKNNLRAPHPMTRTHDLRCLLDW